jgi:hypothetical protein
MISVRVALRSPFSQTNDGSLQMCREDGKPIGYKVKLGPDDRPQRIAGRIVKEQWAKKAKENGNSFNRQIVYPPWNPA